MLHTIILGLMLLVASCGGDADNGGARGDLLDEAAAEAAAMDRADLDCVQEINAEGETSVEASQNCGDGNRIGSDGQTGDSSSDSHDVADSNNSAS